MADALSLLFELDADGRPAVAEFQRVRKAFAGEIAALRKTVAQSFTLPPIKLPTVPTAGGRGGQVDAHIKEFRRLEAEAAKSAKALSAPFDKQLEQNARAAESLQRQRSAGIIKQLRDQEKAAEKTAKAFRDRFLTLGNVFDQLGQSVSSFGRRLSVAVTAPLAALAAVSVRAAIGIDAQVNTLRAFTGSAEAAEQRLAKLIATARQTPGLTTSLSLMLDSQLRLANVTVDTIDKVLPAIGRLNAVQKLQDPARFSQNLVQLVTQNFERIDLKELVGQSPVAGQIIKELFNVDSPINAEAIRESAQRLGLTTTDAFFTAFAEAATRNAALANVTESIATKFDKLIDRVTIALRPLGVAIVDSIVPLINFLIPIVESLGRGFAELSQPVKLVIVAFAGLLAAAGPTAFVLGSMISTAGSLISAYAQLVTLGITPTIKGFQLLSQVMRGTASLAAGQAATTAVATAGWVALGGAVAVAIAAIVAAFLIFRGSQKEAIKVTKEQIEAQDKQIKGLEDHARFLTKLKTGVQRTADEQKRLKEIYKELNGVAQARVASITDEEKRLIALRAELEKVIALRGQERQQQAANLAASLASTAAEIQANQQRRDSISRQIVANTELAESIRESGRITAIQAQQLEKLNLTGGTVEQTISRLAQTNKRLIEAQDELVKKGDELNGTAEEQGEALKLLQQQTGLSARELLTAAKAMGLFKGDVEATLPSIERFIAAQQQATQSTKSFTQVLKEQNEELQKAGKAADDAAKQRNDIIRSAASLAKEASTSFEGALKFMRAFIAANPDLRAAIEKERQLAGKSFEEFIRDALGGDPSKKSAGSGTSIRNAQEQLAQSLEDVSKASAEKLATIERDKNEELLQQNEKNFRLQLIAYRQYLAERARLTSANLGLEIKAQEAIAKQAEAERDRFRARAGQVGLPKGERTKAEADANKAEARRIAAETKIVELQGRQREIRGQLDEDLKLSQKQQIDDINQLAAEYANLAGIIEDALNRETVERFRERLLQLGKDQDRLNQEMHVAKLARDADAQEQIKNAQQLNRAEIDLIETLTAQRLATNKLVVAQRFVEQAKERQAELERQIAFDVEFRGLTEEEAIRKRLEGEARLADSLRTVRDIIQEQVDLLNAKSVPIPKALLDFIGEVNAAVQGLGELPFSEQFRLAEKEFNRINDERIKKIRDVERAVRNRDIAELEGRLLIKRINGEYIGDLEKQLALLKQIAEQSSQDNLRKQAEGIEEAVKDVEDEIIALSDRDPFGPLRERFEQFRFDIQNTNDAIVGSLQSLSEQVSASISAMEDAFRHAVIANILYGESIGKALKAALAQQLAAISAEAAIQSLKHAAYAIGSAAFGNFAAAGKHAAAAAAFAGLAVAAGLAGRALAKSSGLFDRGRSSGTAAVGVSGSEPRNREFQFGGQGVESSSSAAREGSGGGIFGRLVARVEQLQQQNLDMQRQQMLIQGQTAQALTRIQSMRHGDALAIGAAENPAAVGRAVIDHSNSNGDFNEYLQRNLGFA